MPESEMAVGRRELLALLGVGTAGAIALGGDGQTVGGVGGSTVVNLRTERYRPVVGGVALSAWDDSYGTVGMGVETDDGREAIVTCRHVVDDGSDEGPEDVEGRPVYQPWGFDETDRVGKVIRASKLGGAGSSDWAVIDLDDAANWSTEILGMGSVGAPTEPATGHRIVMSGTRGLVGGEINRLSVDANFRGKLYNDLIEYRVDEDRDTAGNSGAVVATVDEATETIRPVGLHTFAIDEWRYAIHIDDVLDGGNVALTDGGEQLSPSLAADYAHVEATIVGLDDQDRAVVLVSNAGGEPADRRVTLRDAGDGTLLDEADVSLDPLDATYVRLERADVVTLEAGQTEVEIELGP